ncbi:(d)CMP kinase [Peptoniphilus sp. KCTC 25270]|uniref:(d)CMP kinase n=1 Tax=Peptoniphilus sp. KCTC 25270 TaxID=2897414 RepID=UPI001E3137B4|nr:(d)CMP kinase [Peptoniphilus sp. KCTC 25270]MCD1147134.1 (d)CMP kinase [Peptoniphilus sp. KCTC 25270]
MNVRIAIDGPSGAGKSSIAKGLAKKLDIVYVDTGALYRGVALVAKENKMEENLGELLKTLESSKFSYIEGKIAINGKIVEDQIRNQEISLLSSKLSKEKEIREYLLGIQKEMARESSVVMEGRDIGSVVIPKAEVKFYLTASPEIRSKRRYDQLREKGETADLDKILQETIERDKRDQEREIAPLVQAEDAILVDSSHMTEEEVLEFMYEKVLEKKQCIEHSLR